MSSSLSIRAREEAAKSVRIAALIQRGAEALKPDTSCSEIHVNTAVKVIPYQR
jgi:hypothetical protein